MWLLLFCAIEINGDNTFEDCSPIGKFKTERECLEVISYLEEGYRCYFDEEISLREPTST